VRKELNLEVKDEIKVYEELQKQLNLEVIDYIKVYDEYYKNFMIIYEKFNDSSSDKEGILLLLEAEINKLFNQMNG
jgi:hypothetical protein